MRGAVVGVGVGESTRIATRGVVRKAAFDDAFDLVGSVPDDDAAKVLVDTPCATPRRWRATSRCRGVDEEMRGNDVLRDGVPDAKVEAAEPADVGFGPANTDLATNGAVNETPCGPSRSLRCDRPGVDDLRARGVRETERDDEEPDCGCRV